MRRDVKTTPRGVLRAARLRRARGAQALVIDVDGCLTDGRFAIDNDGRKTFKMFGPDDNDALRLLRSATKIEVVAVSADYRGFNITSQRMAQLGIDAHRVDVDDRASAIRNIVYPIELDRVVYIGDGYRDDEVMRRVAFGIAPSDAWPPTRRAADAVTSCPGGRRAVAQAADYVTRRLVWNSV